MFVLYFVLYLLVLLASSAGLHMTVVVVVGERGQGSYVPSMIISSIKVIISDLSDIRPVPVPKAGSNLFYFIFCEKGLPRPTTTNHQPPPPNPLLLTLPYSSAVLYCFG